MHAPLSSVRSAAEHSTQACIFKTVCHPCAVKYARGLGRALSPAAAAAIAATVAAAPATAAAALPGVGRDLHSHAVADAIAPIHVAAGVPLRGARYEERERGRVQGAEKKTMSNW